MNRKLCIFWLLLFYDPNITLLVHGRGAYSFMLGGRGGGKIKGSLKGFIGCSPRKVHAPRFTAEIFTKCSCTPYIYTLSVVQQIHKDQIIQLKIIL